MVGKYQTSPFPVIKAFCPYTSRKLCVRTVKTLWLITELSPQAAVGTAWHDCMRKYMLCI